MQVKFYDKVDDKLLKFAVIISKSDGKWVFCKHKERNTRENSIELSGYCSTSGHTEFIRIRCRDVKGREIRGKILFDII